MDAETKKRIKTSLIIAKTDELHYLDQVYKYLKHLEHIYKVGKLEDKNKALQIEISLENTGKQRETLKKEISEIIVYEYNTKE